MSRPLITAIVLAYGDDQIVGDAVRALRESLDAVPSETELFVVTNRLSVRLPDVRDMNVIRPKTNLGFARGVNLAVESSAGEWIAVVNDDCVVDPNALRELLHAGAAAEDVGSVAAQVRFEGTPDVINSAGIVVDVLGVAAERLLGAPVAASESGVTEVFGASGAAALFRRAMLDELGGFDESFFAYLEDADLAWRARMAGWRCVYAPAAVARHRHSSSLGHGSPSKQFLVGRNRVRLLAKNATRRHLVRHGARIVAYDVAYVVFSLFRPGGLAALRGRLAGVGDWRRIRRSTTQRPVCLMPALGFRKALRRNRSYTVSKRVT